MARTEDVTILITGATDGLGERVATKRPAALREPGLAWTGLDRE